MGEYGHGYNADFVDPERTNLESPLAYWRKVLEASTEGGTAWYEARLAQVTLLRDDGRRAEACQLLHGSRGRATSTGADQLNSRLSGMESEVCR